MRSPSWPLGLLLVLCCAACALPEAQSPLSVEPVALISETEIRALSEEDAAVEVVSLSAWDLLPVIDAVGPSGTIPERVVVQFASEVVSSEAVGALSEGTVLSIEPEVEGRLVFTSPSTLEFTPTKSFAPGVSYTVVLEAVATRDGVLKRPPESSWTRRFDTPDFRFAGLSITDFDQESGAVEVDVSFSGPVEPQAVRGRAEVTFSSGRTTSTEWKRGDDPRKLRLSIRGRGLKHRSRLTLKAAQGIQMHGHSAVLGSFEADAELLEAARVDVLSVTRQEGPTGFFVEVVCDDASADGYRSWWYHEAVGDWIRLSSRCIPDEASVRDFVQIEPATDFSIAPSRHGFRILGDFERGAYTVTLKEGMVTEDGGRLRARRSTGLTVPARSPSVSFVSKGRYLPRSNWRNLGVRHLNVKAIEVTVRHIPRENLVFWLSGSREQANARTSNVVAKKAVTVLGESDVSATSWLDLSELVPRGGNGVYEINIASGNSVDNSRLVVTDMNIIAKRSPSNTQSGEQGQVHVWALDVHQNTPLPGVVIDLIRRSGKVLSSCKTDLAGGCRLSAHTDELDSSPAFAILARKGTDQTFLRFSDLKVQITDSFVQGETFGSEKPYRLALWSDRGAYRPGDTVHLAGLLRAVAGVAPTATVPVRMVLRDPHGNPIRRASLESNAAGFVTTDLVIDDFATTGRYRAEFTVGEEVVGRYPFHVEEFVPERMKVDARLQKPRQKLGSETEVEVDARYLFGGSAEGSDVDVSCSLRPVKFSPKENGNFRYGPWSEDGSVQGEIVLGSARGALDADGTARLSCPALTTSSGIDGVAELVARAEVFEAGSGRSSRATARGRVFSEAHLVGLATGTERFSAGQTMEVQGVVVDWDGRTTSAVTEADVELFRLEAEYGWMYDRRTGSERFRRYLRRVGDGERTISVSEGRFVLPVTPSRSGAGYLVRVRAGASVSELYVEGESSDYWWWGGRDTIDETPRPLKPGSLDLELPKKLAVGERATVRFDAPYRGRVLMTVETDRVVESGWLTVEAGPAEWSFVPSRFSPNLYVSALLIKDPHLDSKEAFTPARAFGVASAPVQPVDYMQEMTLSAPEEIRPGDSLEVDVRVEGASGPTWVAVAAVDPGILSLTRFEDPDPLATIFSPRALGVESFETVGWTLLLPPPGSTRSTGGGAGARSGRVQMVKPVALWSGLVPLDDSGRATVRFDVPRHRGALRIMAVSAGAQRVGTASTEVFVREPLVLQPTTPRFLVHGDEFEIPVFVTNTTDKEQTVSVSVSSTSILTGRGRGGAGTDPVRVEAVDPRLVLAPGASGRALFVGKVEARIGAARLDIVAEGGGHRSEADFELPIQSAKPRERRVRRIALHSGDNDLGPMLTGWEPGSEITSVWVTANPYADVLDHLRFLVRYPYGCIEQTTSTTRPLLYVGNALQQMDPGAVPTAGIDAKVAAGIRRILSMQTSVGGFAYWPGGRHPNAWGTSYATHLLVEAKEAGHEVPPEALESALSWLEAQVGNDDHGGDRPYMHYVLARAGRGRKAQAADLLAGYPSGDLGGGAKERIYLLQAALWLSGDRRFEEELRTPDLAKVSDERAGGWDWYSDRRRRALALNVMVDLFGSGREVDALADVVAESLRDLDSRGYTTQELAWGVAGIGRWVKASAEDAATPELLLAGRAVKPGVSGKGAERSWILADVGDEEDARLRWNPEGDEELWMIVSTRGVRSDRPAPMGGNGLEVSRSWQHADGRPLLGQAGRVSSSQLGDVLYTVVHLTNRTGKPIDNIALVDRVPAGWEIENPRLGQRSLPTWLTLDTGWEVQHMNVRDDRVEVFGSVGPGKTVSFAYAVRAVTAGSFEVPAVEAEAMYDPRLWARQPGASVDVEGPWASLLERGD